MKPPPPKLSELLRDWRKLRRELAELRDNAPPRTDPLEAFCDALRPPLEDKPARFDFRHGSRESHLCPAPNHQ